MNGKKNLAHALCAAGQSERLANYVQAGWLPLSYLRKQDERGRTPLDCARLRGHERVLALHREHQWTDQAQLPLVDQAILAARKGSIGLLRSALEAESLLRSSDGQALTQRPFPRSDLTLLGLAGHAARGGHVACLQLLLAQAVAAPGRAREQAAELLASAIAGGNEACVQHVVRYADQMPTSCGGMASPLAYAASLGDLRMIKTLIRLGVPATQQAWEAALLAAIARGQAHVVEHVHQQTEAAAPTYAQHAAAIDADQPAIVAMLAQLGPLPPALANMPSLFTAAVRSGNLEMVRLIAILFPQAIINEEIEENLLATARSGAQTQLLALLPYWRSPSDGCASELRRLCEQGRLLHALCALYSLGIGPSEGAESGLALTELDSPENMLLAAVHGRRDLLVQAEQTLKRAVQNAALAHMRREQQGEEEAAQDATPQPLAALIRPWSLEEALGFDDKPGAPLVPLAFHLAALAPVDDLREIFAGNLTTLLALVDSRGQKLAHHLAKSDKIELLAQIPDEEDATGNTPLLVASAAGLAAAVARCLRAGSRLDQQNRAGQNALHLAAAKGHVHVIREILPRCDQTFLHATDFAGRSPLMLAIEAKAMSAAYALVAAGADVTGRIIHSGKTALHLAAAAKDSELVGLLLGAGAAVDAKDAQGRLPLHDATQIGATACVHLLLAHDVRQLQQADGHHRTPVHMAATASSTVSLLAIDKAVHLAELNATMEEAPNQQGTRLSPVALAAANGRVQNVRTLVDAGYAVPDTTARQRVQRKVMAASGSLDMAEFLAGFSFAEAPDYKLDLLLAGIQNNAVRVVAYAIGKGIPVDLFLDGETTALAVACRVGATNVTQYLVEAGANARLVGRDGNGPGYHAVAHNNVGSLRSLLAAYPNLITERTRDGEDLLHVAATNNAVAALAVLLAHGIALDAVNNAGKRASDIAYAQKNGSALELLLSCGAPLPVAAQAEVVAAWPPEASAAGEATSGTSGVEGVCRRYRQAQAWASASGGSRLHIAAAAGFADGVLLLARLAGLVQSLDRLHQSPLHVSSNAETTARLLACGCDPDGSSEAAEAPLHRFVRENRSQEIDLLLAAGASLQRVSRDGFSILHTAFVAGHRALFARLWAAQRAAAPVAAERTAEALLAAQEALVHKTADSDAVFFDAVIATDRATMTRWLWQEKPHLWPFVLKDASAFALCVSFVQVPIRHRGRSALSSLLHIAANASIGEACVKLLAMDPSLAELSDERGYRAASRALVRRDRSAWHVLAAGLPTASRLVAWVEEECRAAMRHDNQVIWQAWVLELDLTDAACERQFASRIVQPLRSYAHGPSWLADALSAMAAHPLLADGPAAVDAPAPEAVVVGPKTEFASKQEAWCRKQAILLAAQTEWPAPPVTAPSEPEEVVS